MARMLEPSKANGMGHQLEAHGFESDVGERWRGAVLEHVGQMIARGFPANRFHFFLGGRCFHEEHVRPGIGERTSARERLVEPVSPERVGPRKGEDVGAFVPRVAGRADPCDGFLP